MLKNKGDKNEKKQIYQKEQTILSTHETKILIATKYFGDVIKTARKVKNITRKKLADNLGISRRKMLQYENGNQIIPKHILFKLFSNGI